MKKLLRWGIVLLLAGPCAQADEVYTWQSCLAQTQKNNPDLKAAESSMVSAQALESGSYSGYFPQLTGSLGYNYGTSGISSIGDFNNSARSTYSAALTASQNVFNGFQDQAKTDQASAAREVAEAELQTARAKASYDLKSSFMGVLYSQNLIQLTLDIIKRREYNLKLVQLRFESGGENKGSVLLSKAYLEQAKLDYMQAQDDLALAQIQLRQVLGLDPEEGHDLRVSGEPPAQEPPSALDLKQAALATPDYLQSVAQSRSAAAGIRLARSAFFPSLNLTASTSNSDSQWFPDNNRWALGVNLSIPLFSGGRDYYSQKSAGELYRSSEFTRFSTAGQALQKVKQNFSGYVEAVQKLNVDKSFVEAATAREKIAKEKYNNGLLTFDDWDIIETDLINRQKSYLQSQRDRIVSEAAWEQAQGKGVIQ